MSAIVGLFVTVLIAVIVLVGLDSKNQIPDSELVLAENSNFRSPRLTDYLQYSPTIDSNFGCYY